MRKNWHETAWDDYVTAQSQDRKTLNRINTLLKSRCVETGLGGGARGSTRKTDLYSGSTAKFLRSRHASGIIREPRKVGVMEVDS